MSKVKIIDKKSEKSIISEKELLSKLKHPFIINMTCAFQDYENLYLLLDFLSGGDLRFHYNSDYIFKENEIKFFIACIILSLEYIHSNNVIHRDIKPENLVFDSKGYLHLTDFGVAKIIKEEGINDTSGTPGYMAPEVIQGKNHSFPVDFFAIGVIGYELLMGHRPYRGKNRKEIKKLMGLNEKDILIEDEDNKNKLWSNQCINFINRCLKKNIEMRIGYHFGIKELKAHNWFNDLDWNKLYNKNLENSFLPKDELNFDKKYCENIDKISNETFERYKEYMRKDDYTKIFEGFTFFNNENTVNSIENETVTRVSTRTNKQEILIENNNDKNDKNKFLIEKKIFDNLQNKEQSLFNAFMKDKKIKKILVKKQDNYETIDPNKKIIIDDMLNKDTENGIKLNNKTINKEKIINKNLYLKDIITSTKNKNDISPIKIFNKFDNNININNINMLNKNDLETDIKNNNIESSIKEIKVINIIRNNNSSINILENNKNISIPRINFKKPNKKPLNIHNLSSRESKEKDYNFKNENYKENNLSNNNNNFLIYSNFLSKSKKNKLSNNAFILPDIRQFNFRINNKKKIRHMYLNQNRIIENNISSSKDNKHSKILDKFIFKHPIYNNKKHEKIEETYQQINSNGKMVKSQSSIFPLINNL